MTTESRQQPAAWPAKVARNAPCPCGSGEKYKRCCGAQQAAAGTNQASAFPTDPRAARVQFGRAVQLLQAGRPAEAIPVLQAAIRSDPRFFEAHHALGSALLQTGRFADASAVLLRALSLRSNSAEAWRDMGLSYDRQNLHEPAMEAYRNALAASPQMGDVLRRLGQLYVMYSRTEEASACFERAADLNPDSTEARLLRSDARLLRRDISGAEHVARAAVARDPASSPAHGNLAGLLYAQGRFDEAASSFEAALQLNPKDGRCWTGLADCRTHSATDNSLLDRMDAVLQRDDLNGFDRMAMHFAMGKICDARGDYARAMKHFDTANGLRARDLHFDRARFEAMVDQTIRRFTPEFIASHASRGNSDSRPLFIVGMYRSGTTLVEQILSSHPDVAAGGELTVWTPMEMEVDPRTGEFDPERSRTAIAKYLAVLQSIGPSAARVTDKLPFNCFRLGAIHALMPNARIIHCQRDALDTCLSIYFNLLQSRVSFAARKEDLAFCYRQYLRMMEHWRKVLPASALMDVQYERLIADREAETRRLIVFTGLDWNDRCLKPEENKRAINTASAWQARQPVYTTSLHRWRHYEPWLGELR
ncbi:MAG TPA: sulfotransferase, partial [Rhizomicrobium sp.]